MVIKFLKDFKSGGRFMKKEALLGVSPSNRKWYNNVKSNNATMVNYFTNGWEPKQLNQGSKLHIGEKKKIYATGEYLETVKDTVENIFKNEKLSWESKGLLSSDDTEQDFLKLLSSITGQHLSLNSKITCIIIDNVNYHSANVASQKPFSQGIVYLD